jgi:hypothetical protein
MKYRFILALLSLPGLANAAVTYQMTTQSFGRLAGDPFSSDYVMEGDKIRINASDGKTVFIFRDESIYVIDSVTRSAQVLRHATLEESARQLNESVKRLETLAANAAPDRRAMSEQAAAMTKDIEERQRRPIARDYRMTDRMSKSEERACHLWEEWEQGAKRLELCVVPAPAIPGGADVLVGMKSLSPYLHGSVFADCVEFGPVSGWSGIEGLEGVPVIVREFQRGQLVRETRLTRFRADDVKASAFEVPEGYPVQEGSVRK